MDPEIPRIAVLGSFMQASCWRVARLPREGETLHANAFGAEPAGKGLSVALGCHRLGAAVTLVMATGSDDAAERLRQRLKAEGLDDRHVRRHPGPSGQGAGFIDACGGNQIVVHAGANAALDAAAIALAAPGISAAALLYAQLEIPLAAVGAGLAAARAGGLVTVLNPSPWQPLPDPVLRCTDVLVVNATEAEALLDGALPPDPQAYPESLAAMLPPLWHRWPGQWLVVTLGSRGSAAFHRGGAIHTAPAFAAAPQKTLGAGDAFSAGLCWALAGKRDMAQALRIGNACGALSIEHAGILDGLPRRDALTERLRREA